MLKDVQPLLEIDRDERKLDVFLTFHRSSLLVSDMKIFLPFTINLDPYIKKKIKEENQIIEEETSHGIYKPWNNPLLNASHASSDGASWLQSRTAMNTRQSRGQRATVHMVQPLPPAPNPWAPARSIDWQNPPWATGPIPQIIPPPPLESVSKPTISLTTFVPVICFFFREEK